MEKNQPKIKREKAKKNHSADNLLSGERLHFEGLVADLNQSHEELGVKLQKQTDEIKIKNRQLKTGEDKDLRSEGQIRILTKAMESVIDGIFIINAQNSDFPVIYANQSFQKMTGYRKSQILGRSYFLLYKKVDAGSRIIKEIKYTIGKGKTFHEEILSFQKNGKKHFNLLRIAPVRDTKGIVTHYIGIQTDVTSMRENELKIDEQREELLHVTRVGKLAEFVSSLAHEISQPLTAILSYAQAAKRILSSREPKLQEILQYIINDDQRADAVIQRLRMLLKKSAPEIKPLDINSVISETIVLIATDANLRNISLKLELGKDLKPIRGDRIQLQQVILNLVSNSFDALEGSKGDGKISISTSREDNNTVIVKVKDSGCGIPASNMPKLFNHFFTSKPDGLGMGLSISRSIVEAHGGKLDVKNNNDGGATFFFTLPVGKKDFS